MHFKAYEALERKAEQLRKITEENKQKVRAVFDEIKDSQYFNVKTIAELAEIPKNSFDKIAYYQLKKEIMNHANYRRNPRR